MTAILKLEDKGS